VESDAAGRFVIQDIPAGAVVADVGERFRPFEPPDLARFEVVVPTEATLERDLDIVFQTASTSGVVRSPDGAPVAGVRIGARAKGSSYQGQSRSDEFGAFVIDLPVIADLRFQLSASNAGFSAVANDVAPGATGIALVVPRAASARIRVRDSAGQAVDGWSLVARRLDATGFVVQFDSKHRFEAATLGGWRVVDLPDVELELEVRPPGELVQKSAKRMVKLVAGQRADVEIELEY